MKKIGHNTHEYLALKALEDQVFSVIQELEDLAKAAMGGDYAPEDMGKFLADPQGYLVNEFWEVHCKHLPDHLNREQVFRNTAPVSEAELNAGYLRYKDLVKALKTKAPKVTKKGVSSQLKESDFDIYLNPEKEEEYNTLLQFLEYGSSLKLKYNATHPRFLQRYARNVIIDQAGNAKPDPNAFGA